MSWVEFSGLVAALPPDSMWRHWRRQRAKADEVVLEGDALEAAVRQIR